MSESLDLRAFRGREIEDCLQDLAELRMAVFREWPYLYEGDRDYEERYLDACARSPRAFALMVRDGERPVGATTAMPLADEDEALQRPFLDAGIDPRTVFYNAESVLLPDYRGRGLYRRFFEAREAHARSFGDYDRIAFCGVQRPADHPLRPRDYQPLDPIWQRYGYRPHPELVAWFPWCDIGAREQTSKPLLFWLKDLR